MIPKHQQKALQAAYADACNNYLAAFADKHGFDMHDCAWVADEPGEVALIGDYYADMATITTDINENAPEKEWLAWYDYSSECAELNLPDKCNFHSWIHGCPRYSEEKLEYLRSLKRKAEMTEKIFQMAIRDAVEEKNFSE